jgi:hypothetical protein
MRPINNWTGRSVQGGRPEYSRKAQTAEPVVRWIAAGSSFAVPFAADQELGLGDSFTRLPLTAVD